MEYNVENVRIGKKQGNIKERKKSVIFTFTANLM